VVSCAVFFFPPSRGNYRTPLTPLFSFFFFFPPCCEEVENWQAQVVPTGITVELQDGDAFFFSWVNEYQTFLLFPSFPSFFFSPPCAATKEKTCGTEFYGRRDGKASGPLSFFPPETTKAFLLLLPPSFLGPIRKEEGLRVHPSHMPRKFDKGTWPM